MLFFYGTGSSNLGTYPLRGVRCVHCGTPDAVAAVVLSRYVQFFWIPVFPIGKRAVTVCSFCKQALEQAQWPPVYQQPAFAARQQARPPLTNYLGLLLVGVPFVLLMFFGFFTLAKEAISGEKRPAPTATAVAADAHGRVNEPLLTDPRPGDVYAIENPTLHHFDLLQVARVSADSVYLQASTYQPTTLGELRAHPDSVRRHLNAAATPTPRTTIRLLGRNPYLTAVRP